MDSKASSNPTPPPTDAELSTLTPEERAMYHYFDDGLEGDDSPEYLLGTRIIRDLMRLRLAARAEAWRPWSELPEEWRDGRRFLAWHHYRERWESLRKAQVPKSCPWHVDGEWYSEGEVIDTFTHFRSMPAPPQAEKAVGDA